jgi:hypothetical protein
MRQIKIVGIALVAVLAMSAMVAATASAKVPVVLTFTDPISGSPVAPGTEVEMYDGVGFETPSGPMNCAEYGQSGFYGTIATNQTPKDTIAITSPIEIYGNTNGLGACEAPTVLGTASVTQVSGFPATLTLTTAAKATLVPASGKIAFKMQFSGGTECVYERPKLSGIVGVPLFWAPAQLEFAQQRFSLNGSASANKKQCKLLGSYVLFNLRFEHSYIEPWTNPHESLLISK